MTDTPLNATISLRGVVLTPDNELLLVRRVSDGEWELPGGRLGAHEDAVPGLRREIDEEAGLTVDVDQPIHTVSWRNDADRGRFGVYYRCTTTDQKVTLSEEHTAHEWTTPADATTRLSDPQTRAVKRASINSTR